MRYEVGIMALEKKNQKTKTRREQLNNMDVYIYTQKQKRTLPPHLTKFVHFYSISKFSIKGL